MSVLAQVIDMPLLFETGAYMLTWPRVLVAADPATQVRGTREAGLWESFHYCEVYNISTATGSNSCE